MVEQYCPDCDELLMFCACHAEARRDDPETSKERWDRERETFRLTTKRAALVRCYYAAGEEGATYSELVLPMRVELDNPKIDRAQFSSTGHKLMVFGFLDRTGERRGTELIQYHRSHTPPDLREAAKQIRIEEQAKLDARRSR